MAIPKPRSVAVLYLDIKERFLADKRLSETFVKNAVIKHLSKDGWGHFEFDELHTHGVDIKAKKINYGRYIFVEAKGQGASHSGNEVAFVYSLGQIITRMKDGGSTRNYYGLALPTDSAKIAIRRIPWQVAKKLQLFIFAVSANGTVTKYSWQDLKAHQTIQKQM